MYQFIFVQHVSVCVMQVLIMKYRYSAGYSRSNTVFLLKCSLESILRYLFEVVSFVDQRNYGWLVMNESFDICFFCR